jgi:hypothetical protein
MSVLDTLTEGIRQRSLAREGEALLDKWERTGLLEGLDDNGRGNMARLLENQAAQLLKEQTTMQAGDVEGFASVAFPIVRRVFGNLLAQDLVSVQPMSLPSGLIFFMDFTFSGDSAMTARGADFSRLAEKNDTSLYGGGKVGRQITGGVDLSGQGKSFYNLNNGFASPTGSVVGKAAAGTFTGPLIARGTYGDGPSLTGKAAEYLRRDAALVSGTSTYTVVKLSASALTAAGADMSNLVAIVHSGSDGRGTLNSGTMPDGSAFVGKGGYVARRLTQMSGTNDEFIVFVGISEDGSAEAVEMTRILSGAGQFNVAVNAEASCGASFPVTDSFVAAGDPFGAVAGSTTKGGWGLEANEQIPEIDIKVDSVAVTAVTKKLKAKWSPELAQDLNAYHNLDAEVELTSILSEQIALEIDQEILQDLIQNATGGTLYWSRLPGKFVNSETGAVISNSLYPDFTGTVSEWYETLLETVNDVSARIHRKTLRGGANFLVCSPEVANILEFTAGFRASATSDEESGSWGAQNVGSISRKMDVHVDPYFPRNLLLVGRKGSSFLESGYVYAPYVPLQVTPTIFGTEDFVPRKGVMTRYAKKMVRPDMYGLVVVSDLVGDNG